LGGFSHAVGGRHIAESLFRSFQTLVTSLPRVSEKSNRFDSSSVSGGKVVDLIVIENTAKTAGLAHQSFVDLNENRFIAVPLQSPRVSNFFDNHVVSDSRNVHRVKVTWNGNEFTFEGGDNWFAIFVFGKSDPGISNVDVDASVTLGFAFALGIVDDFDGKTS